MKAVDNALIGLDIDPRRFRVLLDLFGTLSDRRELGTRGATVDLQVMEKMVFLLTSVVSLALAVFSNLPAWGYLAVFAVWTTLTLLMVMAPEVANILVNPVEGLVLAHHPINGATYTAAKLTRLGQLIYVWAIRMNAVPALAAGIFLRRARWFYPLLHLAAITALGVILALAICSVFGLLIRFVAPARLKSLMRTAQIVVVAFIATWRFGSWLPRRAFRALSPYLPAMPGFAESRTLIAVLAGSSALLFAGAVVVGLRSLSTDYLIRVESMVRGDATIRTRHRRSRLGEGIAFLCGGQVSRAGFEYVRRMMVRDWEFVQKMARVWPMLAGIVGLLVAGPSPYAQRFAAAHFIPHALAGVFLILCAVLPYGSQQKAAWIFLTIPHHAFRRFARGIHMSLWVPVVGLPHLIVLIARAWSWGVFEALSFVVFSSAVTTIYLSLDFKRMEGIPFIKQQETPKGMDFGQLLVLLGRLGVTGISVGIQYALIFRSPVVVLLTGAALWYLAYLTTRNCFNELDTAIRLQLSQQSGSVALYQEVAP